MGQSNTPPAAPDSAQAYKQGLLTNVAYAPQAASAEQRMRSQYDGQSVASNLQLQQQFGGQFIDSYRQTLAQTNPGNEAMQKQLGGMLSNDLAKGYNLSADQTRQVQQATRARQVESGNAFGNAAVSAEATAVGQASFQAHQQRLQNIGSFLAHDTSLQQASFAQALVTGSTTSDRTESYVDAMSGSGAQGLLSETYQEDLQYAQNYAANSAQYLGPFQRMLNGAYIGFEEGSVGGIWGGLGGAAGGGIDGLFNGPAYQFNVANSGMYVYGQSAASTWLQFGTTLGSDLFGAYGGQYGWIGSTGLQVGNKVGQSYLNNGG